MNVGGAANDEESCTHSGIQSRTQGKEGKHLNISAAGPFRKTLTSRQQLTFK